MWYTFITFSSLISCSFEKKCVYHILSIYSRPADSSVFSGVPTQSVNIPRSNIPVVFRFLKRSLVDMWWLCIVKTVKRLSFLRTHTRNFHGWKLRTTVCGCSPFFVPKLRSRKSKNTDLFSEVNMFSIFEHQKGRLSTKQRHRRPPPYTVLDTDTVVNTLYSTLRCPC